jgi:hypothetical protein
LGSPATPPGAEEHLAVAAAEKRFAGRFADQKIEVDNSPGLVYGVGRTSDGRIIAHLPHDVLAEEAAIRTRGNSEAASRFIQDAYDEELTHGSWENLLRQEWLAQGGQQRAGDFDDFVVNRVEKIASDVVQTVEALPPSRRAERLAAANGVMRLYEPSETDQRSDDLHWAQLKSPPGTALEPKWKFVVEAIRQLSQFDRYGASTETGYLAHIDPQKYRQMTEQLQTVRNMVEAGDLGPMLRNAVHATNAAMTNPQIPPTGE